MSEETSSSTQRGSTGSDLPSAAEGRELNELRKEVVEARNLIIKTDNLLKNMHAELKQMGRRQDEFARRRFWSSVTAYLLFATIAMVGAYSLARSEASREREQGVQSEARAHALASQLETAQKAEAVKRDASDKALRIFEQLGNEKEGPGLNQAMSNALRIDRAGLSSLEGKALEERVASLKTQVAQAALDRGQSAFRHSDYKVASQELGRYLELNPSANDPQIYFHLGFARAQLKEFGSAVAPLEVFIKSTSGSKLSQTAGYWLGMGYEEQNNFAKATEAYNRALSLFPGSDVAALIRNKLRRLPSAQQAAAQAPPAAAPVPASGAPQPGRPAATAQAPR